jgi:hypothetical protein
MKKYILLLSLIFVASSAMAYITTPSPEKLYRFKFSFQTKVYENEQRAGSWDEAYERAAQSCFSHFKGSRGIAKETGLDIIDACANPRSI